MKFFFKNTLQYEYCDLYLTYKKGVKNMFAIKEDYREFFKKTSNYIKMDNLLKEVPINNSNFYTFLSGTDNRVSVRKLEKLRNLVLTINSRFL